MQKRAVLFPNLFFNLLLATLILPCLRKPVDEEKLLVITTKHQKQTLIYTKVSTFLVISLAISLVNSLAICLLLSQLDCF